MKPQTQCGDTIARMVPTSSELPVEFLERLNQLFPLEASYNSVVEAFATGKPTTFRVNTILGSVLEVTQALLASGFELEPVSWYPSAFILRNKSLGELTEHETYKAGKIYVQNLSSMIPPLVLNPQSQENIVDVAAAPGSKTTQLAALMNNVGLIVANDTSTVRLYKLTYNLKHQGVHIVKTRRGLAELLWRLYPGQFDRALVDVPCSMEGRIRLDRSKSFERWSVKTIKLLAKRQRQILRSALSLVKPGGIVVYSTCTLAPEENEAVVDWVLEKAKGTAVLEPIGDLGVKTQPGLLEWQGKQFDPQLIHSSRIVPTPTMEGFFIAKIRRIA